MPLCQRCPQRVSPDPTASNTARAAARAPLSPALARPHQGHPRLAKPKAWVWQCHPLGKGSRTAQGHTLQPWAPEQSPEVTQTWEKLLEQSKQSNPILYLPLQHQDTAQPHSSDPSSWGAQPHCPGVRFGDAALCQVLQCLSMAVDPRLEEDGEGYKSGREAEHISPGPRWPSSLCSPVSAAANWSSLPS